MKNSSEFALIDKLKYTNYKCKECIYLLKVKNHILYEDGAKIHLCNCYEYNKSLWNYPTCGKKRISTKLVKWYIIIKECITKLKYN